MTVRTGKPGMLQFMGSQRVGHDLVTEQQGLGNQNIHCRTVAQCEVSKPEQYEEGIHAVGTGEQ